LLLTLPPALEQAIETALKAVPTSQWLRAAQRLSERYRADRPAPGKPLAQTTPDVLGYAALILPAAYAQLHGAMAATAARSPGWQPRTLLDLGSGPGTALWAATEQWPSLQTCVAWEREAAFITLGRQLAQASTHPAVRGARWENMALGGAIRHEAPQYDLVVLGHLVNELDEATQQAVVTFAWEHCAGVLLLVEPGTSAAFAGVRRLREHLLTLGAYTLAPCAHDAPCPLQNDWCHFPQRLQRPAFQRRAKEAAAGWEESKFSYAALARFPPGSPIWGRLIHQPQADKGGVTLIISSREGIVQPRIPKRDRARYRAADALHWGDALLTPPEGSGTEGTSPDDIAT
jgi:ribosomal protein RSM22 (predicted rRNA methylase)